MRDRMSEVEISGSVHKESLGWCQDAATQRDPGTSGCETLATPDAPILRQLWGIKTPPGAVGTGDHDTARGEGWSWDSPWSWVTLGQPVRVVTLGDPLETTGQPMGLEG